MDRILKAHFDKFMRRGELPPELKKNGLGKEVKLFTDEKLLALWRNNRKGLEWTDEEGFVILRGAVDNILVETASKKLIVIDYKTKGFPVKEDVHEYYQNQLDIYNFLLRMNGYPTEDYAYLLFYVPSEVTETGEMVFDTVLRKVEIEPTIGELFFEEAVNLLKGKCPAKACGWCKGI